MSDGTIGVVVDDGSREAYRPALATLPTSYSAAGAGQVHVVDGRSDWPSRLAAMTDAEVVILLAPEPVDDDRLSSVEGITIPVLVDLPWSSNPTVNSALDQLHVGTPAVLDISASLPLAHDLHAALVDATMLAQRLSGRAKYAASVASESALSASGSSGPARLRVSLIRSEAARSEMRAIIHGPYAQLIVELPAQASAAPGRITAITIEGGRILPTIYQDTHRTSLIRAERIVRGQNSESDLGALVRANRTVNSTVRSSFA